MKKFKRSYTEEYRLKIVKEVMDTGETGVVARRYDIHPELVSRWVNNYKRTGKTTKRTTNNKLNKNNQEINELKRENGHLKKLLGERDLEIEILRELTKKTSGTQKKIRNSKKIYKTRIQNNLSTKGIRNKQIYLVL